MITPEEQNIERINTGTNKLLSLTETIKKSAQTAAPATRLTSRFGFGSRKPSAAATGIATLYNSTKNKTSKAVRGFVANVGSVGARVGSSVGSFGSRMGSFGSSVAARFSRRAAPLAAAPLAAAPLAAAPLAAAPLAAPPPGAAPLAEAPLAAAPLSMYSSLAARFSRRAPAEAPPGAAPLAEFTDNYGTVNMISFLCSVWSRLAYMNDKQYLGHYSLIFGSIIPDDLMVAMNAYIAENIQGILNDTTMFGLKPDEKKFGLETFANIKSGGHSLKFLPWAQRVNQVIGEEPMPRPTGADGKKQFDPNCNGQTKQELTANENIVFVSIATSNYGEVYVTGDKRMPNLVVITFRGTYSGKSAQSYIQIRTTIPVQTGIYEKLTNDNKETYIFGIYKILMEISHVLMAAISHVSDKINPNGVNGSTQLLTTGHSLGGALCTIFAYVYVAHIKSLTPEPYPKLNMNIACISLGSPRIFGKDLANIFCCLTTSKGAEYTDMNNSTDGICLNKLKLTDLKSMITYLRITTVKDPIPALPLKRFGYYHPCSSTETPLKRQQTNEDCLVQTSGFLLSRCTIKRLSLGINHGLPLECVDSKTKRKNKSPYLVTHISYHVQYLGISYMGAINFSKSFDEIKRDTNGDTVCRLIFYPSVPDDTSKASVAFYNLVQQRKEGTPEEVVADVKEEELSKEELSNITEAAVAADDAADDAADGKGYAATLLNKGANVFNRGANVAADSLKKGAFVAADSLKRTAIAAADSLKRGANAASDAIRVFKFQRPSEDISDTLAAFKNIMEYAGAYNILKEDPPLKYTFLHKNKNEGVDRSFQSKTPEEKKEAAALAAAPPVAPAVAAGGKRRTKKRKRTKKYKNFKSKTKRRRRFLRL